MNDAPPDGSYAELGKHLVDLATRLAGIRVKGHPVVSAGDLSMLNHIGDVELPAVDDIVQAATFQALTMSREVVQARRFNSELQEANSMLHAKMIDAQAAAELATNLAEKAASVLQDVMDREQGASV